MLPRELVLIIPPMYRPAGYGPMIIERRTKA